MKKIIIIALLINLSSFAQVKGNKKIETRTFSVENLEVIKVHLYAKVIIDNAAKSEMAITTDANLFELIDKEIVDSVLDLNQLKWIAASQKIIIKIGAPNLKRVESGTHGFTEIINLNNTSLNVIAPVGNIKISGKTNQLNLGIELATIDASKVNAENARVNIWSSGKAIVNVKNELFTILDEDARIEVLNVPKSLKGDLKTINSKKETLKNVSLKWIRFKIKNNSWNRNHFYVVGPKKDGSKFSYGFPMMPGTTRKENWSVGTKIYKVNSFGLRKLLVKIKPEDEGKIVKLL